MLFINVIGTVHNLPFVLNIYFKIRTLFIVKALSFSNRTFLPHCMILPFSLAICCVININYYIKLYYNSQCFVFEYYIFFN